MNKLDRENIEDIVSLTPMQEVMLFNYLNGQGNKQYNEQTRYRISGDINPVLLKKALDFVAHNNEMLRTVYRWQGFRKPVQVILKQYMFPIMEYDFSMESPEEAERLADRIEQKDRENRLDIAVHPFRIILCRIDHKRYDIIITNHHIIYDGWSHAVFLKELKDAYISFYLGREMQRPIKNRYKEFVKWLGRQDKDSQREFWKAYLEGFGHKTVIPYKANKPEESTEERYYEQALGEETVKLIKQYCKDHNVTLATFIYGTWGMLLHKYTGNRDIVFGVTLSGRTAEIKGIESMVGLFINTLPLRIEVSPEEEINSFMEKVSRTLGRIEEYEASLLVEVRTWSAPDHRDSLFDVVVVLQNYPMDGELITGNGIFDIKLHSRSYKTGIPMTLGVRAFDGVLLDVTYNAGLYDESNIKKMVERYKRIINQITDAGPGGIKSMSSLRIKEIEIMDIAEKQGVLDKIRQDVDGLMQMNEVDFNEIF